MKGTLITLAVLALTLPGLTLSQQVCEDVTIVVEVSENTQSGSSGNLANIQNELNTVYQSVPNAERKIGFFATSFGYDDQAWTVNSLQNYFNGVSSKGGYVFQGLDEMAKTYPTSPERVNIAVVYSSELVAGDIPLITEDVEALRNKNYFVTLYAIGKAIRSRRMALYDQLESSLSTGMFTLSDESSVTGLSTMIQNNVRRCGNASPATTPVPSDAEGRCKSCVSTQTSGNVYHDTRCDMFIHCQKVTQDGSTRIVLTEKYCAPGTLFDPTIQVCDHAYKVLNKSSTLTHCSWCQGTNRGPFPAGDTCKAYYECTMNGNLTSNCCPTGESFDGSTCVRDDLNNYCTYDGTTEHIGYCQNYFTCRGEDASWNECCYNKTTGDCLAASECASGCPRINTCDLVAIEGDQCGFRSATAANSDQRCAPGTVFSSASCGCIHVQGEVDLCPPEDPVTIENKCHPTIHINWENGQNSQWGFSSNNRWIGIRNGVDINGGDAGFDETKEQFGLLWYTGNAPYSEEAYLFRASVKETSTTTNKDMVIFSNRPCNGGEPSVLVTMNPSSRTVTYTIRTDQTESTSTLSYNSNPDAWKEVSLRYDSTTGKMNTFLRLLDNNDNVLEEKSDEKTLSGRIQTSSCPLKFAGEGDSEGARAFFTGRMDDIKVYGCSSDQTPDADSPSSQP